MIRNYNQWMELIREVMHVGKESYILEFAQDLRYAPQTKDLHDRWREVSGYAQGLDLESIAEVMVKHGWKLNRNPSGASRTVESPAGSKFRLSPSRYIAAWADEVPRLEDVATYNPYYIRISREWWDSVEKGKIPDHDAAGYSCISAYERHKHYIIEESDAYGLKAKKAAVLRIQNRAMVQYLRARLWMNP